MTELNTAELYLREHYRELDDLNQVWDYNQIYAESAHSWSASQNISAMLHYRYDLQAMHTRGYFLMHYALSGEPKVQLRNGTISMKPGDVLFVGPDTPHSVHSITDETIVLKYYIRRSTFEKTFFSWLGDSDPLSVFFRRSLYDFRRDNHLIFSTGEDITIQTIALSIYVTLLNAEPYCDTICEAKLTEFFCYLLRDHAESVVTGHDVDVGASLGRVIAYLRRNYATATLEEAVRVSGYSKCYLCDRFHRVIGKTFTKVLNEIRIDAAAKMLETTTLTIPDISERVGYKTVKHFYRNFKNEKGITPLEWRKAVQHHPAN